MATVIPKPHHFFPGLNHTSSYSRSALTLQEEKQWRKKAKKKIKSSRNTGWEKDQDKKPEGKTNGLKIS